MNIFFIKSSLCSYLKNVLTKDFPMQPFANLFQIRCYCKFPNNHKNYLFLSLLFLIHVLIKLQDWWPAILLKKRPQHRCFPVNTLKCLKKTFCGAPPVAVSENGFKEFVRISKGGLTRNNLYDLSIWTYKLQNCGDFLHWNVYDTILKKIRWVLCFQICMKRLTK